MNKILLVTINETLRISGLLSPATLGQSYLATLTGYAGLPPYVWSISGALPDGITVTTDSNNDYVFSGTPTEAGTFPIVVTIMDSEGRSVSRSFDLLSQALPLTISGHLPNGAVGGAAAYSYTLEGGYGARVVTVFSGSLPAGTTISTAGAVSGTYTTAASNSWILQVEDSLGSKAYLSDSNAIAYATLSSTGALTDADVGDPVGGSITLSGGDGSYTVDASPVSGTRPPGNGLSLVGAVYSDPSGVLTTAATYTWTDRFRSGDGQTLDINSSIEVSVPVALPRYWRLYMTAYDSNPACGELQFRATAGGASLCTGGTAFCSQNQSGYGAEKAFDGLTYTAWLSSIGGTQSLGYVLPTGSEVNQLAIYGWYGTSGAPKTFIVQSSQDGVTWDNEWSVADAGTYGAAYKLIDRP